MLHHSQAMSLDDIYLEDIPHIIHPNTAAGDLADTARLNRIINGLMEENLLLIAITRSKYPPVRKYMLEK
ncbi:hypothetical protein L370_02245 [Enterobacter sp. MGH 24]|nr:hypothetical protein L370_02245 [Enterobacter sp. MGH 24]